MTLSTKGIETKGLINPSYEATYIHKAFQIYTFSVHKYYPVRHINTIPWDGFFLHTSEAKEKDSTQSFFFFSHKTKGMNTSNIWKRISVGSRTIFTRYVASTPIPYRACAASFTQCDPEQNDTLNEFQRIYVGCLPMAEFIPPILPTAFLFYHWLPIFILTPNGFDYFPAPFRLARLSRHWVQLPPSML